ncbi:MAG: hypothetical protein U0271_10835 [Polyangiaceae bacterium]
MSKVTLRLRDLDTGNGRMMEHDSIDATINWLSARPNNVEVLGVVFEGLSREDNDRMKAAMRPLDDLEKALAKNLDDKAAAERQRRAEERAREAEADANRAREAAKNAPVDRPMELAYRFDRTDLQKTDKNDDREITAPAIEAVMAWVHERQEWVAGRGQTVGEAKVTVYPTTVPKGKDRVVSGSFVPVTAPEKTNK